MYVQSQINLVALPGLPVGYGMVGMISTWIPSVGYIHGL
jgi:hypothetical protein